MEYFYFPTSHWSRVVSLIIAEKGIEPIRRVIDIRKNETFEPEYIQLNPRGVVPTVVDEGEVVWDSPQIARHLDSKAGPRVCAPPRSDAARWEARLEDFPLMLLSYSVWTKGLKGERSADILDDKVARAGEYAERYPELRDRYERKGRYFASFRDQVYDAEGLAKAIEVCSRTLADLAIAVEASTWLGGERWGLADALATSILYRLVDLGLLDAWHADSTHPLARYLARLEARPSFAAVFQNDPRHPFRRRD